jgi:hypothetical protein
MAENFVLFGMLCTSLIGQPNNITCMNFWEDPIIKYETREACSDVAKIKAEEINKNFDNTGLTISQIEIHCISVDISPKERKIIL